MDTIKAISSIVELRIKEVGSHSHRVAALIRKILRNDKESAKMHQDIIVAAFLHDIGKVCYPDKIIEKKMDQYTQSDMEFVRRHPVMGQSCISQVKGFEEIGRIIRHHHENFNGTGFPDNLSGEEILYGSRLIRVADVFDHHAFGRGYPNQKKLNDASAYLVRNSNSLFDPEIIKLFIGIDLIKEFNIEDSSEVEVKKPSELEEGMIVAEDVTTNNGVFLLPRGMKLSHGMINRIRNVNKADAISKGIHVYRKSQKILKEKNGTAKVQNIAG